MRYSVEVEKGEIVIVMAKFDPLCESTSHLSMPYIVRYYDFIIPIKVRLLIGYRIVLVPYHVYWYYFIRSTRYGIYIAYNRLRPAVLKKSHYGTIPYRGFSRSTGKNGRPVCMWLRPLVSFTRAPA